MEILLTLAALVIAVIALLRANEALSRQRAAEDALRRRPATPPPLPAEPSRRVSGASTEPAPVKPAPEPPPPPELEAAHGDERHAEAIAPPPVPPPLPALSPVPGAAPPAPTINWERFMGAKLFAWVGGLAFFLGVAYGIKYSFDHDLVPPVVRAVFGMLLGLGLIGGGLRLNREKYAATQQSLCATGTLILYAVAFACRNVWAFPLFTAPVTFGLMALITAGAFLLAERPEARVVAVLGIAGGFLTPALLATGHDAPYALFGYIALLDAGLLTLALRKRWNFLAALGAFGTLATQAAWWENFHRLGRYENSPAIFTPMLIFLGLQALFAGACLVAKRRDQTSGWLTVSGLAAAGAALLAGGAFVFATAFKETPAISFAYLFVVEAGVFALGYCDRRFRWAGPVAACFVFTMLAMWSVNFMLMVSVLMLNVHYPDTDTSALILYSVFALLHTALPLALRQFGKTESKILPIGEALMPFVLLFIASAKTGPTNDTPIFTCAFLLTGLFLALGRWCKLGALAPVTLAGVLLLEAASYRSVAGHEAAGELTRTIAFAGIFLAYPFVFHRTFAEKIAPWSAAALGLLVHAALVWFTVTKSWPGTIAPGLIPAAFAVPAFAGLALIAWRTPKESPARPAQLALFGGAALFFVTVIFPAQLSGSGLALALALEGAALGALFRRTPHRGILTAGLALSGTAFAQLAYLPVVLGVRFDNRYPGFNPAAGDLPEIADALRTYLLAALALGFAARMISPVRAGAAGILRAGAVILLFLLMNIVIADAFAAPGRPPAAFDFTGNFSRDMVYSLGWAGFALALLVTGIVRKIRPARLAAIALLAVTLAKLFLHDLASLDQLYRIGALLGVAIIAGVASFLYQKFLPDGGK